ncbi:MAG: hypothetical protein EP297_01540 [Gammaproteobacteria bacterium]|nr:MAG: hypothetical protein EP297_01540 [Gammaproteobacteria bacterium]
MHEYTPLPLSDKALASFFFGLSQMLKTGMPLEKALPILVDPEQPMLANAVKRTSLLVSHGKPLADAGRQSRLFRLSDYNLVQVGENAGNLIDVTRTLAEQYEARASRSSKIRSRMLMPVFVLFCGVLLAPVPAVFSGKINAAGYLMLTLLPLVLIFFGIRISMSSIRKSHAAGELSFLDRLSESIPAGKTLYRDLARLEFLEALGVFLRAGVDAQTAFGWSIESVNHPEYRMQFQLTMTLLESGNSVSDALQMASVLDEAGDYAEISSGEKAGKLEESIMHRASLHHDEIEQRFDMIAQWVPRIVYVLVVAWFVTVLLG